MPIGPERELIGFYSILQWTPDPALGETINAGLLLAAEDGTWARFRARPLKTRASLIASPEQIAVAQRWIAMFESGANARGPGGLLEQPVSSGDVRRWAADRVGTIGFTDPKVVLGSSFDELWASLSARYLGRIRAAGPRKRPTASGTDERREVITAFVASCRRVEPLRHAVHRSDKVEGIRFQHQLDITIRNGHVAAVAQALPFAHGSAHELAERRALLVDAALDLPDDVLKLALFDRVPPSRAALFEKTREFFAERLDKDVRLHSREDFPEVAMGLTDTLFATERG